MSTGVITRAKRHQLGIRGNMGACRKILKDIRLELKGVKEYEDEEDKVEEIVRLKSGKRPTSSST
ncbi:hypothetical protein CR513_55668, partial [Mucuna pruriens]